jgi:pimeloyl-ACP methyl ester carboxylesterase
MANFVLVHGSWAGGWQWTTIREALEKEGHRVLAPSLTGMADRHHLINENVGLETHIDDIARLIEWEDLDDVILVGHSYGGMVITGAAACIKDRLSHLVYIDAFLPRAGECAWDLLPWQPEVFETLRLKNKPWQVEPVDKMTYFPELESFDMERSTPMTIRTHSDLLPSATTDIQGTYIECTQEPSFFGEIAKRAKSDGMRHVTIEAGHYVIITHSSEVVEILKEAAIK